MDGGCRLIRLLLQAYPISFIIPVCLYLVAVVGKVRDLSVCVIRQDLILYQVPGLVPQAIIWLLPPPMKQKAIRIKSY